jgi:hypothetical protein
MSKARRLTALEVKSRVRDALGDCEAVSHLSEEDRNRLTIGTSMEGDVARCMVYIPGERPQDATIICAYDVDRQTGVLKEVERSEW